MANEIGKINLNFQVEDTGDPKLIIIKDFSKWRVIENMPSYMEITMPGSNKPITVPFEKNATNAFNSLSLGVTCHVDCEENMADLNDGIYEFCLRGGKDGSYKFHRYYLKKDNFQENFDKAWIRLGLDFEIKNETYINKLLYIEGYLNAACAATRQGMIPEAHDFFMLAEKELRAYINCKNCI